MRSTRADLLASLWFVAATLLVVGALYWLIDDQAEPVPSQPDNRPMCVQIALSDRGLPACGEPGVTF